MSLEDGLDGRFTILHDFQLGDDYNDGSNMDHLVISPTGIYIVETKYKSCFKGIDSVLKFDREYVTDPNGFKSSTDIKQVEGFINQFKDYCNREFGVKSSPVKPEVFLVYAGWSVNFSEARFKSFGEYNVRVNFPTLMLKAMKTVTGKQSSWNELHIQNELIRHLNKGNMVKVGKK